MKNLIPVIAISIVTIIGCAHCGPERDAAPNIRTQPGIEYCSAMCSKFEELQCTGYYEPITIDCTKDKAYQDMPECQLALALIPPDADISGTDAGLTQLPCTKFCEYEMKNSVQLNPKCLSENLKSCDTIETVCN